MRILFSGKVIYRGHVFVDTLENVLIDSLYPSSNVDIVLQAFYQYSTAYRTSMYQITLIKFS